MFLRFLIQEVFTYAGDSQRVAREQFSNVLGGPLGSVVYPSNSGSRLSKIESAAAACSEDDDPRVDVDSSSSVAGSCTLLSERAPPFGTPQTPGFCDSCIVGCHHRSAPIGALRSHERKPTERRKNKQTSTTNIWKLSAEVLLFLSLRPTPP